MTDRLVTRQFVLVCVSEFWALLAVGLMLPITPVFAAGVLGAGSVGVGLAVAATAPTGLLAQPFAGRLADRIGRRRPMLAGGAALVCGCALLTLVESLTALVAVRLVIGVGEALVYVAAATMINDLAPPSRRGEAVSLYSLAMWGALAAGPPAGELLLGDGRYDVVWLVAAGIAALSILTAGLVRETHTPLPQRERTARARLLHPAAILPGLTLVLSMIGYAAMATFAPLYARELGLSGAGLLFAINALIVVTVRLVGRRIPDVVGPRRTALVAMTLTAIGLAVIAAWRDPIGLYAGTVVLAFGQALVFPALMVLVVRAAPDAGRSAAVGSFTAFADLGFAAGAISLGAVAAATGYTGVFVAASLLAALGVLPLIRAATPRPSQQPGSGQSQPV